jgi:hypothetical protein
MFRLCRWLRTGKVNVLFLALVQHVVPLCLQWPLAQFFPAALQAVQAHLSLYFFDA